MAYVVPLRGSVEASSLEHALRLEERPQMDCADRGDDDCGR
jgi:hypothetical protein